MRYPVAFGRRSESSFLPLVAQMGLIKKIFEPNRCPLCSSIAKLGVFEHLKNEHRRTEAEARALMERQMEGTLGWDPEVKKSKQI